MIQLTQLEKRGLYDQWHRYYMGLYAVQGRLKLRKEKLETIGLVGQGLKRFILNPFVLLILIAALVLLVLALR